MTSKCLLSQTQYRKVTKKLEFRASSACQRRLTQDRALREQRQVSAQHDARCPSARVPARRSGWGRARPTGRGGGGTAAAGAAAAAAAVLLAVCLQTVARAVSGTCLAVPALLSGSSVAVQLLFSTK